MTCCPERVVLPPIVLLKQQHIGATHGQQHILVYESGQDVLPIQRVGNTSQIGEVLPRTCCQGDTWQAEQTT
jgi:hypothetical protein